MDLQGAVMDFTKICHICVGPRARVTFEERSEAFLVSTSGGALLLGRISCTNKVLLRNRYIVQHSFSHVCDLELTQ